MELASQIDYAKPSNRLKEVHHLRGQYYIFDQDFLHTANLYHGWLMLESLPTKHTWKMLNHGAWKFENISTPSFSGSAALVESLLIRDFSTVIECDWLHLVNRKQSNVTVSQISEVVKKIQFQIASMKFEVISKAFLQYVNCENSPAEMLIALLRGTFVWRAEIKSWNLFKERVALELSNRNLDANKLLYGLNRA